MKDFVGTLYEQWEAAMAVAELLDQEATEDLAAEHYGHADEIAGLMLEAGVDERLIFLRCSIGRGNRRNSRARTPRLRTCNHRAKQTHRANK